MVFFDNLFDISNKDEQLVTGLNRELNCIYIYDYFNKYNKIYILFLLAYIVIFLYFYFAF